MLQLSVIICAHNSRRDYLVRVLEALGTQSLPFQFWELVLVDNASNPPLAPHWDLSWHPHSRHVREEKIGLTAARVRSIAETTAPLLVFVDDDNVLAADYLERASSIASAHPEAGAWSGNVELEFDAPAPEWTRRYWPFLVERRVERDALVCNLELAPPMPVGAGLCVRRVVAERYGSQLRQSEWRQALDRKGANALSAGDADLALTACDLGLSRGEFQALRLTHLIPPKRLTEEYLLRLAEGIQLSGYLLEWSRNPRKVPPGITAWWWLKFGCDCATKFGRRRRFFLANKRAQRRARAAYEQAQSSADL